MTRKIYGLAALAGLCLMVAPVFAHHATQAEFDQYNTLTIKGVMKKILWVNPHVNWHLDVLDPSTGKTTTWVIVAAGPGAMRAAGLSARDYFKVGDVYEASIALARNGSPRGHILTFKTPDGRILKIWGGNVDDPLGQ